MEPTAPLPPPPSPPHSAYQFRLGKPTSWTDENGVQNLYAVVHGSTGMPVDYGSQFNQLYEDVEFYGPFTLEGPVAIAFDMASICAPNNQVQPANFPALARWVKLALESKRTVVIDTKRLKILYVSFLIEAVLQQNIHSKSYPHEPFQYDWGRLEQAVSSDVPNFRNEHLPTLTELYTYLVLNISNIEMWEEFFSSTVGKEITFLAYKTKFAEEVARGLAQADWVTNLNPSIDFQDGTLIDILVNVLGPKFFRNLGSQIEVEPDFQLVCRYGGHLIDAIAVSLIKSGGIQEVGEVFLPITLYSPDAYKDGVMGTPFVEPLLQALNELRDEYNNNNIWQPSIWNPLADSLLPSTHSQLSDQGTLSQFEPTEEAEQEIPEEAEQETPEEAEQETLEEAEEENQETDQEDVDYDAGPEGLEYYQQSDDGIETETQENEGAPIDYQSCTCKGTKVIYKLKWSCQDGHVTDFGDTKENVYINTLEDGDCASRIHEEVKQIFPFITEFENVRADPNFPAPPLVFQACSSNNNLDAGPALDS